MITEAMMEVFREYLPEDNIRLDEPMSAHTTFRIGGPACALLEMETTAQLSKLIRYLNQIECPYFLQGNGSNILVSDKGYQGVVLQILGKMNRITVEGNQIRAQAGALMSQVAAAAKKAGLTGLEFASGIPGTVGGGVVMNAGAYGGEMSQVVKLVTVVDKNGETLELDNDTMEFSYRHSSIKNKPFAVAEVLFALEAGDASEIQARMDELAAKRREKQPLEYASAGSTFKRPEGAFAGELIMKAGLRGFQIGGAKVSDKHCGFVINTGNASAADVMDVICETRERVKEKFGVELEPEIVFYGEF